MERRKFIKQAGLLASGSLIAGCIGSHDFWDSLLPTSGLVLWLRADVGVSYDVANNVTQWSDYSGNGFIASPIVAPLYQTNVVNGQPAILFNGTTQYLEIPYNAALNTSTFTLFIVCSYTGTFDGFFHSPITSRDGPSLRGYYLYKDASENWTFGISDGTASWVGGVGSSTIIGGWKIFTALYDGTNHKLYEESGLKYSLATNYASNTVRNLRIGAGRTEATPTYFFPGYVAEVLYYNRGLSDTDRRYVESYLGLKYGITVA